MEFWTVQFPGHPQETTENAVDLAHLRYVHGYSGVDRVGTMSVDGVYLRSCFDFKRTQTIAGIASFAYDVSAVTHVYGLGYSFVEVHERFFDMETRLWVLATPVDGTLIEMVLVRAGAGNPRTETAHRRYAIPSSAPAHHDHEENHHGRAKAGRVAGCP